MATLSRVFVLLAATALFSACSAPVTSPSTSPAAETVSFDELVLPFVVTPPPELEGSSPEQFFDHVLNWEATTDSELRIRGLIPVMYFPESGPSTELPDDYAAYIGSIEDLIISDQTTVEVDGHEAQVFSIEAKPGSYSPGEMGCGVDVSDANDATSAADSDGCFGFPDDLLYRYAVVEHGDQVLLIWARSLADRPDPDFFEHFDEMLSTLRFLD